MRRAIFTAVALLFVAIGRGCTGTRSFDDDVADRAGRAPRPIPGAAGVEVVARAGHPAPESVSAAAVRISRLPPRASISPSAVAVLGQPGDVVNLTLTVRRTTHRRSGTVS